MFLLNANGLTVTLTWDAPAGGCVPTGYVIETGSTPGSSNLSHVNTGSTARTFSAGGVPAGTYYVRVRAANGSGTSGASNEVVIAVPGVLPLNLSGTWNGSGSDAQGPETFTWTLVQTGKDVSGTAIMQPLNTSDGSCGSCHKQKVGTFSGTISGTALAFTLAFPAGGRDLTPLCGITMTATTFDVTEGRVAAAYTGSTTCEGPITDGTLVMTR